MKNANSTKLAHFLLSTVLLYIFVSEIYIFKPEDENEIMACKIDNSRCETAYNLRDSENKLNGPLPHTNYYKNNFSYSGAIL